eukprot:TRINITY_DN6480_c0_g1_i1.p1 TRINITY_DN6480_c0_g1~~TRINITY_DN6480_c0_g1_i1.p1  ORF type:complete len:701 (+),score=169.96 TRINITY_DN6480_c0_g1_i1:128-2230(+)
MMNKSVFSMPPLQYLCSASNYSISPLKSLPSHENKRKIPSLYHLLLDFIVENPTCITFNEEKFASLPQDLSLSIFYHLNQMDKDMSPYLFSLFDSIPIQRVNCNDLGQLREFMAHFRGDQNSTAELNLCLKGGQGLDSQLKEYIFPNLKGLKRLNLKISESKLNLTSLSLLPSSLVSFTCYSMGFEEKEGEERPIIHLPNLNDIRFNHHFTEQVSYDSLLFYVTKMRNLTLLDISGSSFSELHFVPLLKELKLLKVLDISYTAVGSFDLLFKTMKEESNPIEMIGAVGLFATTDLLYIEPQKKILFIDESMDFEDLSRVLLYILDNDDDQIVGFSSNVFIPHSFEQILIKSVAYYRHNSDVLLDSVPIKRILVKLCLNCFAMPFCPELIRLSCSLLWRLAQSFPQERDDGWCFNVVNPNEDNECSIQHRPDEETIKMIVEYGGIQMITSLLYDEDDAGIALSLVGLITNLTWQQPDVQRMIIKYPRPPNQDDPSPKITNLMMRWEEDGLDFLLGMILQISANNPSPFFNMEFLKRIWRNYFGDRLLPSTHCRILLIMSNLMRSEKVSNDIVAIVAGLVIFNICHGDIHSQKLFPALSCYCNLVSRPEFSIQHLSDIFVRKLFQKYQGHKKFEGVHLCAVFATLEKITLDLNCPETIKSLAISIASEHKDHYRVLALEMQKEDEAKGGRMLELITMIWDST